MSREYKYDDNYDYNPVTDRFIQTTPQVGEAYVETGYISPVKETEQARIERVRREKREDELNREAKYSHDDYLREEQRIKERIEMLKKREQAKLDAVDLARDRYYAKSNLYKFFHRKLSDKRAQKMSVAQINELYGGIENEKGKSR